MVKLHIKKGDLVAVTTGKDKGKKGKIIRTLSTKSRVIVEGVNMVKRHTRPTQKSPQGGIISKEGPIHISNVQIVCPSCGQPTRIGRHKIAEGKGIRICRRCGAELDKG